MNLFSLSIGHIGASVTFTNGKKLQVTRLYRNSEVTLRKQSWKLLQGIASPVDIPWLICGDFNKIVSMDEKMGGDLRC